MPHKILAQDYDPNEESQVYYKAAVHGICNTLESLNEIIDEPALNWYWLNQFKEHLKLKSDINLERNSSPITQK